jgi:hypothetical protein
MPHAIPNRFISHSDQWNTGRGCASVLNTHWSSGTRSLSVKSKNRYLSLHVCKCQTIVSRDCQGCSKTYVSERNQLSLAVIVSTTLPPHTHKKSKSGALPLTSASHRALGQEHDAHLRTRLANPLSMRVSRCSDSNTSQLRSRHTTSPDVCHSR